MIFSFMTYGHNIREENLVDYYRMLKDIGYEALDLGTREIEELGEEKIRAAMDKAGLGLGAYISFSPIMSVDREEFVRGVKLSAQDIDLVARMGGKKMMVCPLVAIDESRDIAAKAWASPRDVLSDNIIAGLRELVPYAEKKGVKLCLEDDPHRTSPLCSIREMDRIFEAVPEVELTYDTGNMLTAGEDPMEYFERYKYRIGYVHLKDVTLRKPGPGVMGEKCDDGLIMENVPFGTGIVDFEEVFRRLRAIGFDGICTHEHSFVGADSREEMEADFLHIQPFIRG